MGFLGFDRAVAATTSSATKQSSSSAPSAAAPDGVSLPSDAPPPPPLAECARGRAAVFHGRFAFLERVHRRRPAESRWRACRRCLREARRFGIRALLRSQSFLAAPPAPAEGVLAFERPKPPPPPPPAADHESRIRQNAAMVQASMEQVRTSEAPPPPPPPADVPEGAAGSRRYRRRHSRRGCQFLRERRRGPVAGDLGEQQLSGGHRERGAHGRAYAPRGAVGSRLRHRRRSASAAGW